MSKKHVAAVIGAIGLALSAAGTASAASGGGTGKAGSGAPTVFGGTVLDLRCAAPWSNGAVLGGVLAPGSKYAACNGNWLKSKTTYTKGPSIFAAPVADGRCLAPWSNGAVGGLIAAPGSEYAACNG